MTTDQLIQQEESHQIPTYSKLPIVMERGESAYVWDADGNRYLDFYGGHCVCLLGHSPPAVVEAVQEQAGKLVFYSNVAYSTVRAEASARLAEMAPDGMEQVFFANSGSEANETALKLARKHTGRSGVLAMEQGFHGRTLGSLALTYADKYRAPYRDVLPDTRFVPFGDADAAARAFEEHGDHLAAVVLEPIQSIAGVQTAAPSYFRALRTLCDEHGVQLIFDEVQTGVGRTGTFSISEQLGMKPDLISLAKSLGAGVPVSSVLVSDEIAAGVESGDQGSTFGGGMLAMAAVKATLDTIRENDLMARATSIFGTICAALGPHVRDVRGRGCLIGVELDRPAAPVRDALLREGVLTGTSGDPNTLRLMPPINTPDEALDAFVDTFQEVLERNAQPA
jgi:acetylornithine/succinyldiaminopimelate/putrescine aminotransferase